MERAAFVHRGGAMKVTLEAFEKDLEHLLDVASSEPVEIVDNGSTRFMLVSWDHYELLIKGRIVRRVEEMDDATRRAVAAAEPGPGSAQFDAEVD
jgi:PHD/YefM family antitoxin component YafN of YafNO toxin-antitoxin module